MLDMRALIAVDCVQQSDEESDKKPVQSGESVDRFWNVEQCSDNGEDTQADPEFTCQRTNDESIVEFIGR